MITWEYLTRPATVTLDELNALGADGWQVVGPLAASRAELLLRRPVRETAAVTGD